MRRASALLLLAGSAQGLSEAYVRASSDQLWEGFKRDHRRSYANDAEEQLRKGIFVDNMLHAARLQEREPMASFGATKFSDLAAEEFKVYHSLKVPKRTGPNSTATKFKATLASVDWRSEGAVTSVKDQGQCGSCWSFSATGGIEGAWKNAGNSLVSVSEQELVSCDKVDSGCSGGLMDNAFGWLIDNHGGAIVTEASYPYTSGGGSVAACSLTGKSTGAVISAYHDVGHSEDDLASALSSVGPISIAVDASSHWQSYTGGVVSTCTGTTTRDLDHGVLLVGMSSDYWVVKNSWGTSWGESGYIRLARGSDQCGLSLSPSYPVAGTAVAARR